MLTEHVTALMNGRTLSHLELRCCTCQFPPRKWPTLGIPFHGRRLQDDLRSLAVDRHFLPSEAELLGQADRLAATGDRKSTRLNSSHQIISYAVFCLKKKNKQDLHH